MYPTLFHIGPFVVHSFGVMAALALLVPIFFAERIMRRYGRGGIAYELLAAAGIGGFAGARVYYMLQHWGEVHGHLLSVLVSGVGLTWYGGLLGGAAAVVAWSLVRRLPLGLVANALAPAVALGYAIGRVGCQLAGDGDYGKPSGLPWAMGYPHGTVPTPPGVLVHPTPIYEILVMVPVFILLYRLASKPQPPWRVFAWYLVLSGIERFLVEFLRRNPAWLLGLTGAQWFSLVSAVAGLGLLVWTRGKSPLLPLEPGSGESPRQDLG